MYDLLIKDGWIADGSGKRTCYKADVALSEGKITGIGENIEGDAKKTLNAKRLIVSPGFIDNHSHSDISIMYENNFANKVEQGITTEVVGNCGGTIAPISFSQTKSPASGLNLNSHITEEISKKLETFSGYIELLETRKIGCNWAYYAGHGTIRAYVMGNENRKPSKAELESMKNHVRDAMESGALGITTGLIYPPGSCSDTEELVELSKVVAEYGGTYCTHMRSEGNKLIESIEETLKIGEQACLPVNISHLKIKGNKNWHKLDKVFEVIDKARNSGMKISADMYPYTASATGLVTALPNKYLSEGIENLVKRLNDKDFRKTVKEVMQNGSASEGAFEHSGFDNIIVLTAPITQKIVGKTIAEVATERGEDPFDTLCDIIVDNMGTNKAGYISQKDENLTEIFKQPYIMGGTDAGIKSPIYPLCHPRQVGTFPRLIKKFVKDQKIISIEEAVYRFSGLPADNLKLKSKGLIREGYDADITVFDLNRLTDHADFASPGAKNEGIVSVIINGEVVVENDNYLGIRIGQLLKRR